jgi:hypothetical protein
MLRVATTIYTATNKIKAIAVTGHGICRFVRCRESHIL